jgi:Co/Zn/Cd efflux system component
MSGFHKHNHQAHQNNYKSHTLNRLGWSLGITVAVMAVEFIGGCQQFEAPYSKPVCCDD